MKVKTVGAAIEEFVRLKPKMYSYLADNIVSTKKAKSVNQNVVATISLNVFIYLFIFD